MPPRQRKIDIDFLRKNLGDSLSLLHEQLVDVIREIVGLTKSYRVAFPDFLPYEGVDLLFTSILESREYITLFDFILERYFSLVKIFVEDIYYDIKIMKSLLFMLATRIFYHEKLKTYGIFTEHSKLLQMLQILIEVLEVAKKLIQEKIFDVVLTDKVRIVIDEKYFDHVARYLKSLSPGRFKSTRNEVTDEVIEDDNTPEFIFINSPMGMKLKEIYSIQKLPAIIIDGISLQGINLFDPESVRKILSASLSETLIDSIKEERRVIDDIYNRYLTIFTEIFQTSHINKQELRDILLDMRIKIPLATKNILLYYTNFSRGHPCFFSGYPVLMENINFLLENLTVLTVENIPLHKMLLQLFALQDLKAIQDSVLMSCSDTSKIQDTIVFIGNIHCPCCKVYFPLIETYAKRSSINFVVLEVDPDSLFSEESIRAADYYYTYIPNFGGTRDVPLLLWTSRVYYPVCHTKFDQKGNIKLIPGEELNEIFRKLLSEYYSEVFQTVSRFSSLSRLGLSGLGGSSISNVPSLGHPSAVAIDEQKKQFMVNENLDPVDQAIELIKKGYNLNVVAGILSKMYNTNITPGMVYKWIRSRGYKVRELRKYAEFEKE